MPLAICFELSQGCPVSSEAEQEDRPSQFCKPLYGNEKLKSDFCHEFPNSLNDKMNIQTTTILAGLVIGSVAYHLNVDNEFIMGMPSYLVSWLGMSLGALIGAFLISIFSNEKASRVALLLYGGIILSIVGRMVYDSSFTSSGHNLFPIELTIYSVLCLPTAFAGAYLGKLISRWKKS